MDKSKEELLIELNELQQKLKFIESGNTNNTSNKKLLENDEHYRYLFENNPQPMWIYDIESLRFLEINDAAIHHYGYSREEFLGMTIKDIRPEVDLKKFLNNIKLTNFPYRKSDDWQHLKKNGEIIFVDIISYKLTFNNRKARHVMVNDITERKNALIELQLSKMELEEFFENDISADIILSIDGFVLSCNNTFLKLFGLTKKPDPDTLNFIDFYKNPEQGKILVTRLIKERKIENYSSDFVSVDGKDINAILNVIGIFDENDKLIKVRGYIVDITKQIKAEAAIRLNDKALKIISQGVIITDVNRLVISANESFTAITGYSESEIIGRTSKFLQGPLSDPITIKAMSDALKHNFEFEGEILNYRKDGTTFWNEMTISPLFNNEGSLTHFIGVTRDITERKKIFEELIIEKERAEQSDKLKSAFLANMSHEIRTPMNGILGFTDLLKNPDLSNEKQQKFIDVIQKSGTRLLNIIDNILDISKIEAGLMTTDIKATNIKEQIEFVYTFFKPEYEKKGLQFFVKKTCIEDDLMVETDPEKIYAIFTNLIKNAIKYTNNGSVIFGYERKGEYLEFYVKDTGIGIPKDKHDAIFERFIQADISNDMAIQGAGLGLSITKSYVELLGGKIRVESELENLAIGKAGGTAFYFTIPFNTKSVIKIDTQKAKSSGKSGEQTRNLKILIAEDDEASSLHLSILVEEFSSEILIAKNGFEAIEIYKNNSDIDLILMDMQMPYLNGYDATSQIRQLNKNVVIFAQTAYALSGDQKKTIEAGCNDYISKPISSVELSKLIRKYFN